MKLFGEMNFWEGFGLGCLITSAIFFVIFIFSTNGLLKEILSFFSTWNDIFIGCGYIAISLGIFFTAIQIYQAKNQNRANLSYQIQKDNNYLEASIQDQEIFDYITSKVPSNISESKKILVDRKIREIFQFYATLHDQKTFGNLKKREWKVINKNLCNVFNCYNIEVYWKNKIATKVEGWPIDFINLGNEILSKRRK